MKLTSSAFDDFGTIPKLYTCDGQDISVPLSWSGAPKGTAWLAVTVIDPGGPVTHWYVIDIPAATTGIKQGASYPNSSPGKQVTSWLGMCPQGPDTLPVHRVCDAVFVQAVEDIPRGHRPCSVRVQTRLVRVSSAKPDADKNIR